MSNRKGWAERKRREARQLIRDIGPLHLIPDPKVRAVRKALLALTAMEVLFPSPNWVDSKWFKSLTTEDRKVLDKKRAAGLRLKDAMDEWLYGATQ